VLVDHIAFVGMERDREDATVVQVEQLVAGGASVVIAVGPEQEIFEAPVGFVDIVVAIAADTAMPLDAVRAKLGIPTAPQAS